MSQVTIPNFGELLAEHLSGVSPGAYPYLLSRLERTAADRYRHWAESVDAHRDGLLDCAAREDEIADRVEALFPPTVAQRAGVDAVIPIAKQTYYSVFEGLSATEQMTIQADAENQGANAWQNMKAGYPQHAEELDELSTIELGSAAYLDDLLANIDQ